MSVAEKLETFELIQPSDLDKQFPVNARKLHGALNVGAEFSTWIKRRLDQYEFKVEQDYQPIYVSSKTDNELVRDYILTVEMAKELAMIEHNEAGRKVRHYFLQMERQAKGLGALYLVPNSIAQENAAAAIVVEAQLKMGALLGAPQSLARAHAVTEVTKLFPRVNAKPLIAHNPEEQQELDLIPTTIAKELGLKSAREANQLLTAKGYQVKNGDAWELTEKGKQLGTYHKMAKAHSNGTPIQQIKWKKTILKALVE